MRVASRRRRVAECARIRIFAVIVAMTLRDARFGLKAAEHRRHRQCDLPLLAILAMMRRRRERGEGVVRIERNAEIVIRPASGESEGERLADVLRDAGDERVLAIVVVRREPVVLPMLDRGVHVRVAECPRQ